jgi:hypothetical protein
MRRAARVDTYFSLGLLVYSNTALKEHVLGGYDSGLPVRAILRLLIPCEVHP